MADFWKNTDNNDLKGEYWKDIQGYEGLYQVSNLGRVRSMSRLRPDKHHKVKAKILRQAFNSGGYPILTLSKNAIHKNIKVHRLVAKTFIPNSENKPCIDHINTIRTDNRVENLLWTTGKENCNNPLTRKHMSDNKKGEKNHMRGRLSKEHPNSIPIIQLTKNGQYIRTWDCARDVSREIGIHYSNVNSVLRGKTKTAGGYKWMYKSEYNGNC